MRIITTAFAALVAIVGIATAKSIKIRGYVTEVHSQTSFDIDDYRITRDKSLTLDFEKEDGEIEDLPAGIRVGTELEIKGSLDVAGRELHATRIRVFPNDLRKLKRTAVVEQTPALQKAGSGWQGTFRVDGQTLRVNEETNVSIVPKFITEERLEAAQKRLRTPMWTNPMPSRLSRSSRFRTSAVAPSPRSRPSRDEYACCRSPDLGAMRATGLGQYVSENVAVGIAKQDAQCAVMAPAGCSLRAWCVRTIQRTSAVDAAAPNKR